MTLEQIRFIFGVVTDQRKSRRFDLKLTMQVLRCGNQPVRAFAQTANVSSNGVLFHSDMKPEVGETLEYLLTLIPDAGALAARKQVQLHCMGKVVRHDEGAHTAAATLERYEFLRD